MNAYTYGIQNFLHTSIAFNIQLFSDEYGNKEEAQGNTSGFYYYDIYKETDENNQEYWDVDGNFGLNPEQYAAIIDTEGIFPTQIPIALIRLNGELLESYFPDLAGTNLPVYEIESGRFVIKTDRVIPLDTTSMLGFANKRKKRKVTRASNQLGETGAFVTIFVSSDGAKLERAYQQITELDSRELVLFVETKDKDNILGTVMRIKTGSGIGVSEQGIPFPEIIKIPSFLNFNIDEGLLRKIIKRHFHNLRDGEENVFYIILKKSRELIEIPAGYSLKFSILALNKLIDGATETFRLDEKRWNDKHPDYTPLIPLPINGKVDFSIARKEFQDSMDGLATGLAILNRTIIVAPFLRPLLEPKLKTLNRAFTKELPKLVDTLLEEAGENILNAHHFYNSLLVGILNSIIDLVIGISQLISLLLQVYEAELGAAKQLTENLSSFLSMWIELLENGLEIFTNLLTEENFTVLLLFQQKMMVKLTDAGIDTLLNIDELEIPHSHIGYYSGFIIGFVLEEILIALATGGTGNIAQATNLAMQSFSQTLKGAGKFAKKGAQKLTISIEDFIELLSQLRKESKNVNTLLKKLDQWVDELLEKLGFKTISKAELKAIDDAIEELGIKISVSKNTLNAVESAKKLESIIQTLRNKIPPKHFNPEKNALKELGIKLPVSKNGKDLSVDFADTKYLYPARGKQKNIVRIKLTGARRNDDKLAFELSGIKLDIDIIDNYTWHHLDDYDPVLGTCTVQLVESKVHTACYPHYGGVSLIEKFLNIKYK